MSAVWRFSILVFFLIAVSVADDSHGENVIQYTEDTFTEEITKKPHFVMFFAPWCGHCKRLAPTFDQLGLKHNTELKHKQVTIAKVDCTEQTALCSTNGVTGYPTLKFFNGDEDPIKYSGPRTLEALDKFIGEKLNSPDDEAKDDSLSIEVTDGLYVLTDKTFNDVIAKGHTFVKFFAPWCGHCKNLAPTWDALAKEYEHNTAINIAKVDCTQHGTVCQSFGVRGYPTLILFKDGEKMEQYRGSREQTALSDFVMSKSNIKDKEREITREKIPDRKEGVDGAGAAIEVTNGLFILTDKTFDDAISKGHTFVKFFAPWCGHCKRLAPTWDALAKEYEHSAAINIAKVDCTQHESVCSENNINGYPTLIFFKDGKKLDEYQGPREQESLSKFIRTNSGLADSGKEEEKQPEEDKEDEGGSVIHLDSKTFETEISKGFTFVKFFAPWCGHCKALAPTWAKLSNSFRSSPNIKIAKIDCTLEEALCESHDIEGFPTLYLFHNGQKMSEHKGERDLETLRKFVLDQVPHDEL